MPNTIKTIPIVEQVLVDPIPVLPQDTVQLDGQWKRRGARADGKAPFMKAFLMQHGQSKPRMRLEFGGGAVTYTYGFVTNGVTDRYLDGKASIRSGWTEIKARFWDDSAKVDIWLHADPGVSTFEIPMTLEGMTARSMPWGIEFANPKGIAVGTIPLPVIRAFNAQAGTLLTVTGRFTLAQVAAGSYTLTIVTDPAWMAERFAAGDTVIIDPTTVATSIDTNATSTNNSRKILRLSNGTLVAFWFNSTTGFDKWHSSYSTDGGQTWAAEVQSFEAEADGSACVASDNYLYVMARLNSDMYFHLGTPNAGLTAWTWTSTLISGANSVQEKIPDVVVHQEGTGWKVHAVWFHGGNTDLMYTPITISSSHTATVGSNVILDSTVNARTYSSISVDSNKNLYVVWQTGLTGAGQGIRHMKGSYSAGAWTWGSSEIVTESYYDSYGPASTVDDSGRVIVAISRSNDTEQLEVYERSTGGTWSQRMTPESGIFRFKGLSYDSNGNIYLFYRNNNTDTLYYKKYDRGAGTWGSAVTVSASVGSSYPSVKRGYDGNAIDVIFTNVVSPSPYSVKHERITLNSTPNGATVTASATAFAAADGTAITIAHSDPDNDNMQSYYLKRVAVTGGAIDYWKASTLTWDAAETENTITAATSTTIPAADNATDWTNGNSYDLYAKTKDAGGLTGAYGSALRVKAAAKPVATVTAPADPYTGSTALVTWTYAQADSVAQQTYRVRLYNSDRTSTLEDTGVITSTDARSRQLTYSMTNATTYQAGVLVTSQDGVAGAEAYKTFTVSFTPPATPTIALTADATNGRITVVITNSDTPDHNVLERSTDNSNWYRVKDKDNVDVEIAVDGTFQDYMPRSGITAYYRALAVSTADVESAASTAASTSITLTGWWLHMWGSESTYNYHVEHDVEPVDLAPLERAGVVETFGTYPVVFPGRLKGRSIGLSFMLWDEAQTARTNSATLVTLAQQDGKVIVRSWAGDGFVCYLKDPRQTLQRLWRLDRRVSLALVELEDYPI